MSSSTTGRRGHKRTSSLAVAVLLVLGLAACSDGESVDTAANLQRFYDQELAFGSCDGYATTAADAQAFAVSPTAQCARLEVPLDYDDAAGRPRRSPCSKCPREANRSGRC
ncbi:hypothetical protein ACHIPZ_11090 [Antrihabitans sp. NCIMB 15449]|uniref:Uncharacterized protein n=1 Tax=Antrihabitans spumae TaxID=3373370 RepID=A0ABW7JQA8_9NOCA